jgi:hypothetical protein
MRQKGLHTSCMGIYIILIKCMKVVIADVVEPYFPAQKLDYRMQELENLVNTYGGVVIVEKIQKR